jgi:cytochrome P450
MRVDGDQGLGGGRMLNHRCVGSHPPRMEITVALQERFHTIPDFAKAHGAVIKLPEGIVRGPRTLPLMFGAD